MSPMICRPTRLYREQTKIRQGWLEPSNIDVNREYAMVMEAQRAFQACSSALQIIDQIDQKSASEIASL
ncbi:MAG: flagellar basal body rod C-terminal domain-containing protein [Acutalibacteraceae bacterium]